MFSSIRLLASWGQSIYILSLYAPCLAYHLSRSRHPDHSYLKHTLKIITDDSKVMILYYIYCIYMMVTIALKKLSSNAVTESGKETILIRLS